MTDTGISGKVLLIGADGQLGTDIYRILAGKDVVPLTIADLDITKKEQVDSLLRRHHPRVVINTAAYNRVDDCEKEDLLAFSVNASGVKDLAFACREIGATLVHFSTDYVFDGEKGSPYGEDDAPCPRSAYGITKLAGEFFARYITDKHLVIRTSSLFGAAGCLGKGGGNFVETMLKLGREKGSAKVVTDQIVSPTYTVDLARKSVQLIAQGRSGLYHVTNKGQCSWYDFARKIFELARLEVNLKGTTSNEFRAPAHRPKYSVLAHGNLEKIGMDDLPTWDEALSAYLKQKQYIRG